MRIDPESAGGPVYGRRPTRPVSSSGSPRRSGSTSAPETNSAGSRVTSQLLTKLREMPDVRPEVVEDVRRRLERGELLSREDAEATAEAILTDLQSFLRT